MILSGFLFNSKNCWAAWLPSETLRDEWSHSVAVDKRARWAREWERGGGQPSGSEIRFLRSQWRARPLSSISEISSVVRIRPHHLFLSHDSACFIGPSQEREDAMRSFVANILHALSAASVFSHVFSSGVSLREPVYLTSKVGHMKVLHSNGHNKDGWLNITTPANPRSFGRRCNLLITNNNSKAAVRVLLSTALSSPVDGNVSGRLLCIL